MAKYFLRYIGECLSVVKNVYQVNFLFYFVGILRSISVIFLHRKICLQTRPNVTRIK